MALKEFTKAGFDGDLTGKLMLICWNEFDMILF